MAGRVGLPSKTHTASLLARPSPLNINLGRDRFNVQQRAQGQSKQGQRDQRAQGQSKQGQRDQSAQGQSKQDQRDQSAQGQNKQGQRDQGQRDQGQRDQSAQGQSKQDQAKQRDQGQRDQTTGQAPRHQNQSPAQSQQREQTQPSRPQQPQQGQAQQAPAQQGQSQQSQAGGTENLTADQRIRVQQTVLARSDLPRVNNVNFALSVGTVVPASVRIVDVDPVFVEIFPQFRGHKFFVVRDDIVIIDKSRKVVSVVPVGSSAQGGAQLDTGHGAAHMGSGGAALNLSSDQIRQVQMMLIQRGFDIDDADGVLDQRTVQALIAFQRQQGFEAPEQNATGVH